MKKKSLRKTAYFIFVLLFCGLIFACNSLSVGHALASERINSSDESAITEAFYNALAWECKSVGAADLQGWMDEYASLKPTNGNVECFIMAMQAGLPDAELDYSAYGTALAQALETETDLAPATRQRSLILLNQLGYLSALSQETIDNIQNTTIGEKGIMSYVYGLRMLTETGLACEAYSPEDILQKLLELQLSDGGWAVTGKTGDVDVTAMVLQAIATYTEDNYSGDLSGVGANTTEMRVFVYTAFQKGVGFLVRQASSQMDFGSSGVYCSESTAQVLLFLCVQNSENTDFSANDFYGDFLQNNLTPLYGLLRYQLEDGSFSHTLNGQSNELATSQAAQAMGELLRQMGIRGQVQAINEKITAATTSRPSLRIILSIILGILYLVGLAVILILARKNKKNPAPRILSLSVIVCIVGAVLWLVKIQSAADFAKEATSLTGTTAENISVTISIDASATTETSAGDASETVDFDKNIILAGPSGTIFPATTLAVGEGTTALELLISVCAQKDIQIEYTGAADSAYIQGINYLYAFDYGDLSGWMYRVNGEFPNVGCGNYTLKNGDVVEWIYTTTLGKAEGAVHD